ncbi:MAG: DUF192 domain-containing protein [Caldimonas sp.]
MTITHRALAALLLALAACAAPLAQDGPQKLPSIRLSAGIHYIDVELARSPAELQTGLMFRPVMGANQGMLFEFERAGQQCFWMKNTLIPLSVAFLADDGSIVNIEHMAPQTLESHCSARPVRFVLEMNEGWFAKRGVKPGSRIRGAPFAR